MDEEERAFALGMQFVIFRLFGMNNHLFLVNIIIQRCQLLRITRSHYGKLQKFSIFYGLQKTRIFLLEFFKKVIIRNVVEKSAK